MKKRKRNIILTIVVLVVVGLGIWAYSRWDVWFGNPPEAPYTASKTPSRVLLTFGNEGELSRMVSWMCGDKVDENAVLLLADSTDTVRVKAIGEVFESRAGKAAYYRAELKGLKAEHTYSYAVKTNGTLSKWYSFTTSNPESESFSFLYMGDVQDTINGVANILLKKAISRHPEVEFVAFGGDLIERPTDAYFAETFRSIDSVCTAMPIVNVTGNHDYLKYLIRKCERRFALTFPYFLKGMEERNDNNHLFSFVYHNTQFFLLDSERGAYFLLQQKICQDNNQDGNLVCLQHFYRQLFLVPEGQQQNVQTGPGDKGHHRRAKPVQNAPDRTHVPVFVIQEGQQQDDYNRRKHKSRSSRNGAGNPGYFTAYKGCRVYADRTRGHL